MAKIRSDFDGLVLVHHKGEAKFLGAGDTVPAGVKLSGELVEKPASKVAESDAGNA